MKIFVNFCRPKKFICKCDSGLAASFIFFAVEVRVCSSVWRVRFVLFHQAPVAVRFVSVWVGIANNSVPSYNLFSSVVQQSPLLTSVG